MSGREWKPGDVAMVTTTSATFVAARDADNDGWNRLVGLSWHTDRLCKDARPLVVIDAEDREQVERLTQALGRGTLNWYGTTGEMQGALRSLLTPPRPDEPTGLGAVVEARCVHNINRQAWVRHHDGNWHSEHGSPDDYGSLLDVKVLSDGITS